MKVKIIGMDHNGSGIAKIDEKIIFIPKCVVGDEVLIDIVKKNKKYDVGRVREIISESDKRVFPICPYYDRCGGCNISNFSYQEQLEYKKHKIINMFKKYLGIDILPSIIESSKEYKYRNKITYHVDNKIGLIDIDNKLMSIDNCLLVSDKVNELYRIIKMEDLSKVKKIQIRECENGLMLMITGRMNIDRIKDLCLSIYMDNKCIINGNGYIFIGDIKYRVSDKSFFQVNTCNISKLYDVILKYGDFRKEDTVIDLYCGVGSISLYVSKYVKSVLGIEIVPEAIVDANENAKLNNIENVKFICGDVSKLVSDNISGDVVIVDPPRAGLDKKTIEVLNNKKIDKIIYVSCDPMTLVRDIKLLDSYEFKEITLVDMFPQTYHVESVVLLTVKKDEKNE